MTWSSRLCHLRWRLPSSGCLTGRLFPSAARRLPVCHVTEQAEQSQTLISADMINEEEAGAAVSTRQLVPASGVPGLAKIRGLRTAQAVMVANATTEISVDSSCLGQDCGLALGAQ